MRKLFQNWVIGEEQTFRVLDSAWELGITTIDTANVYSNGESERIIGKWIKQVCGIILLQYPEFAESLLARYRTISPASV